MSLLIVLLVRILLVGLFLPFSALDKMLNFNAAVDQAAEAVPGRGVAILLICGALGVEVFMSMAVLAGVADRIAALVLAAYCGATALIWKPFWRTPDFQLKGPSVGRDVFWDFLKNLSLAGGFLLLTFGTDASGVHRFLAAPFASSRPYAERSPGVAP